MFNYYYKLCQEEDPANIFLLYISPKEHSKDCILPELQTEIKALSNV